MRNGAELHRLDRAVDRAERGHHDELCVGLQGRAGAQHVEAVHSREVQVEEHEIVELLIQLPQRFLSRTYGVHPVAVLGQHGQQKVADVLLVFHDEHARGDVTLRVFFRHGFSVVGPSDRAESPSM